MSRVAPQKLVNDEESFNPNATATNFDKESIEPEPMFPPIRGAEPPPPKDIESTLDHARSPVM